jgi:ABC-type sulfate/molybdate transport systems ATPase subunit/ABC-type sulfate transport system permease component
LRGRTVRSPLTWLGGLLVLYLAVPVVGFLIRFSRSNDRGFGTPGLWNALWVSTISATVCTAIIAVLGVPLAFALSRSRSRLAGVINVAVLLPLALPPLMSGILLIYLVGPYTRIGHWFHGRLTGSVGGIVLAQTFVAAPFLVIAARSAFAAIDPALDEVAATLGLGGLRRFVRVSLPEARSAIVAGMLLTWLRAFGEYGATVLLSYHPYSLPVFTEVQFSGSGLPPTEAPTVLAILAAGGAVAVSRLRRPGWTRTPAPVPVAVAPSVAAPTSVGFDLDASVGSFRLSYGYAATSHRLAILGPSGSGKSITLRALAGLLDAGAVSFGGADVRAVPAERRGVGYVPQGYGLIPHLTVWEQVRLSPDSDGRLAAWWLSTLGLEGLGERRPAELSGGQRQRVSLARAMSRSPRVVLLDEPFSGLDAPVREELRHELRRLQRETGLSTVLVTHDPAEAALLADEVVVIDAGRLVQAGPCREVFRHPTSPLAARLLGVENVVRGRAESSTAVGIGEAVVDVGAHGCAVGTEVVVGVRASQVSVGRGGVAALVVDVDPLGSATVSLGDGVELRLHAGDTVAAGDRCAIRIEPGAVMVWSVDLVDILERRPTSESPSA